MAIFTERVRFMAPVEARSKWKAQAAAKGISPSAFLRDKIDDMLAAEEFADFLSEFGARKMRVVAA